MSLKYKVKLIHNAGYAGIQESIGKEFDAAEIGGLYYIPTEDFNSNKVPLKCHLVFNKEHVEVVAIETTYKSATEL